MGAFIKCKCVVLTLICLGLLTACATTKNYAPVKDLNRNLQKGVKYYRVQPGDTLYSIGFRAGYDYHKLAEWNRIKPPYKIKVGQELKLFNTIRVKRVKAKTKAKNIVQKKRTSSQKKLIVSTTNKRVLKLHWQWPVKGKILRNFYRTGKKGIDILGKFGQKVKSAAAGKVVYSGDGLSGYGNLIIIKHNDLYLSAYANNSRLWVNEGQQVKTGQVIANIGRDKDQKSTLHFEIRKNGKPVNPVGFLPKN